MEISRALKIFKFKQVPSYAAARHHLRPSVLRIRFSELLGANTDLQHSSFIDAFLLIAFFA